MKSAPHRRPSLEGWDIRRDFDVDWIAWGTAGDARGKVLRVADGYHARTLKTIKGNLFLGFAYNVGALPLAAAGAPLPVLAGAAMAFSGVSHSLRPRRFQAQ